MYFNRERKKARQRVVFAKNRALAEFPYYILKYTNIADFICYILFKYILLYGMMTAW